MTIITPTFDAAFGPLSADVDKVQFALWANAIEFAVKNSREVLTANRVYYVRTDGSDLNDGLVNSAARAVRNIQKAVDLTKRLDCNGFSVTIEVVSGTHSANINVDTPLFGTPTLLIKSASAGSATLAFTSGYGAFGIRGGARVTLQNFIISNSGAAGQGVVASDGSFLTLGSGLTFGACPNRYHVEAIGGSTVNLTGPYTITGNATSHMVLSNQSILTGSGGNVTIANAITVSNFINAAQGSSAVLFSMNWTGAANVTGGKFSVSGNSVIDVFGAGLSHLPGTTAGTLTTGAQYI